MLFLNGNNISEFPNDFCEMNLDWTGLNYSVTNNHLCSNLPECIAENNLIGIQVCDTLHTFYIKTRNFPNQTFCMKNFSFL